MSPDIFVGDYVGPVPYGYCYRCNWVQRDGIGRRCEQCKGGPDQIEGYGTPPPKEPEPVVLTVV